MQLVDKQRTHSPHTHTPIRSPPGTSADVSPRVVFLLAVISTLSRIYSARAPSKPLGRRLMRKRWLSVPSVGRKEKVLWGAIERCINDKWPVC